jgi:hypothetical protein
VAKTAASPKHDESNDESNDKINFEIKKILSFLKNRESGAGTSATSVSPAAAAEAARMKAAEERAEYSKFLAATLDFEAPAKVNNVEKILK